MIGTTCVVVDSASYLPASVRERYGLLVVPMIVVVDGVEFREFVDIDSETFYRRLSEGARVSTSQPRPGQFLSAYEQAAELGAERIMSIHIGSAYSGTVNSARLAARMSPIPVHIVDTAQASFIEGLCVWEACERLEAGESLEDAEAAALTVAKAAGNVFIVRGLELLARGGRSKIDDTVAALGVPILALRPDGIRLIGSVTDLKAALDSLIAELQAAIDLAPGLKFRIGIANGAADELASALETRVRDMFPAMEVMQYEVGPAVGAHTGPGCTGIVFVGRPAGGAG